eukprot:765392-Hanusia_phi.AAC.5
MDVQKWDMQADMEASPDDWKEASECTRSLADKGRARRAVELLRDMKQPRLEQTTKGSNARPGGSLPSRRREEDHSKAATGASGARSSHRMSQIAGQLDPDVGERIQEAASKLCDLAMGYEKISVKELDVLASHDPW